MSNKLKLDTQYIIPGTVKWAHLNPDKPGKGYDPNTFEWGMNFYPDDKKFIPAVLEAGFGNAIKTDKKDGSQYIQVVRKTKTFDGKDAKPIPVVTTKAGPDGKPLPFNFDENPLIGNDTRVNAKITFAETTYRNKSYIKARCFGVQIVDLQSYGEDFSATPASSADGGEAWGEDDD